MQVKNVSPLGGRVFIKVVEPEASTTGGILLPTSAQKKPTQGEVVNVGGAKGVSTGDKVVYSKYAGTEVELQGEDFIILKEEDVVGVLKGGDDISKLHPCADRVLIEIAAAENKTAGGLLLTEGAKEKPTIGKVVAVGPGNEKDGETVKPNVSVGSTVLYQKYSGTEFEGPDDKQYIVIREGDILAAVA